MPYMDMAELAVGVAGAASGIASMNLGWDRRFVLLENGIPAARYQSGQTVFSDTYTITVLYCVYTWLILKFC